MKGEAMKPIRVEVWRRVPHENYFMRAEVKLCASHRKARQWAERQLGVIYDTDYGHDVHGRWYPWANVFDRRGKRRSVSPIQEYAPSVADVGYW